jgi:HEAT repeat protein
MGGRPQVESLIFLSQHGSARERCAAIADLEELKARDAVPALLDLLNFPDNGVRANVAQALGQLGGEDTGPALLTLLRDSDALVRMKAAESLGELRYEESLEALTGSLIHDSDPLVRIHVAEALGDLGDPRALPSLLAALDDPDERVRAYVADSIGRLGSSATLQALTARIASETSTFAKAFLLAASYRLGNDEVLTSLIQLSEMADDDLAVTILNLVVELATRENVHLLKSLIGPVAESRPSLSVEVRSLLARLNAFAGR